MSNQRQSSMALLIDRHDQIGRIEVRIGRLGARATKLLGREHDLVASADALRPLIEQPAGRLRTRRRNRKLARTEQRLETIRTSRSDLVERELRTIMLALQDQSRRTRERLDEELARLAPVQEEWERLSSTFGALEAVVRAPALEKLTGQWEGVLQIPSFPIQEREGNVKPFPQRAVVF